MVVVRKLIFHFVWWRWHWMRVPVHEWQLNGVEMAEQRKRKRFNSLRLEKENVFKIYIRVSMLSLSLSLSSLHYVCKRAPLYTLFSSISFKGKNKRQQTQMLKSGTEHSKPRDGWCGMYTEWDANNLQIGTKLHIKRIKYYNDHNTVEWRFNWETNGSTEDGKTPNKKECQWNSGCLIKWNEVERERKKHWTNERTNEMKRMWRVWQSTKAFAAINVCGSAKQANWVLHRTKI